MKLDLGKVIVGAFVVPWWHWRDFLRVLAFPIAAMATLGLAWYFTVAKLPPWTAIPVCVAYGVLFAIFAVSCHRLVLLDARRVEAGWSRREFRFLFWLLGIYLVGVAIWLPLWTLIINVAMNLPGAGRPEQMDDWMRQLAAVPAFYVGARLAPILPAVALEQNVSFRWAWRFTRGNGWRLVVVVGVLPWAISQLVGLLYRSDPTALETAALTVVGIALFAVEIAALSISYRELNHGDSG